MTNSLQIEDHQDFQRRQWRAERIGWLAMALLIVAAVAGLLGGGGVLADASSASADGRSRVEYQRFARKGSTTTLEIIAASGERELRIRIDERYLSAMSLRSITPPPLATVLSERSYTFSFNRAPGAIDTRVKLHLEPDSAGSLEGAVTIGDAAPLRIRHFIFP